MENKVIYITYATGDKYIEKAKSILPEMKEYFDDVILYEKNDIDNDFYIENQKILNSQKGAGYWLWKPYFILKTLEKTNYNDLVFYLDVGDYLHTDIKDFISQKTIENDGFFIIQNIHRHLNWTKNDCFELMNCNSELYYNANQLEAGCCAFRKNDKTISFVKEWLEYCKNYDVISSEYKTSNSKYFIEHRFDQSILTNLKIKHNIPSVHIDEISRYVSYNKFF